MSAAAHLRRGWCPGALRPMRTGDGLLARIRISGGRLSLDHAEAIAQCAARFGNGLIEISSRANLQLRGIRDADLAALQARLADLGLLDADEATESLRNIVASPTADLDEGAILDPAPIVAALDALLSSDRALRGLPAKFGFVVDGGGALPLGDVEADIRFAAIETTGGAAFEISLAGDETIAARIAPSGLAAAARGLALAFLREAALAAPDARRMRHLVRVLGAAALFARAGLTAAAPVGARRRVAPDAWLGVHRYGATFCVGAAPSLGRIHATDLALLARESRGLGAANVRLTPWRGCIVTGLAADAASTLAASLERAGFTVNPADPLLAIVACSGAPACVNATRDVRADALALARDAPAGRGIVLHISGCTKGCARSTPTPLTLVAREDAYDLVHAGKASDAPSRRGLSLQDVATILIDMRGG
jgi:precorrin-3B synthase